MRHANIIFLSLSLSHLYMYIHRHTASLWAAPSPSSTGASAGCPNPPCSSNEAKAFVSFVALNLALEAHCAGDTLEEGNAHHLVQHMKKQVLILVILYSPGLAKDSTYLLCLLILCLSRPNFLRMLQNYNRAASL